MAMRHLCVAGVLAVLASSSAWAQGWDVGPWDPAPFGQPTSRSAESRAQIAAARAGAQAKNPAVQSARVNARTATVSGTRTGTTCVGNVGSIVPPNNLRAGSFTAVTDVRVGTVNVLC